MPIKILEKLSFPTLFGDVELPQIMVPAPFEFPEVEVDERKRKAFMHAVGADISSVIPWVGDVLEDLHIVEIKKILTPEEFVRFLDETKVGPDTIALIRVWTKW